MTDQSRLISLIEVCLNVALGFVVSFSVWPLVAWVMGYPYSVGHNLAVTGFFTVLSIIRGYVVRRFFATGMHRMAARVAERVLRASR